MSSIEKWIIDSLSNGKFKLSIHAVDRMHERCVSEVDIRCCGRTTKTIEFQSEKKTWKVIGKDIDGYKITVICTVKNDVLIVTVY